MGAHLIPPGDGGRERPLLPLGHLWATLGGLYFFLIRMAFVSLWEAIP